MRKIILASGSPRRRELMTEAGLVFEVEISHKEEEIGDWTPEETVCQLSLQKASDIAKCVRWLIDDEYTTGQIIEINGGWNM